MRKIDCNFILILWILLLTQLIPECTSSSLNSKSEDLREVNEIDIVQEGSNVVVPTHLIREYGYYILNDNGFSSNSLICEFEDENLQLKYMNFASTLAKVTSKLLLNIKLTNSNQYNIYNQIFSRILHLESEDSGFHYFLGLKNMYEQLKYIKDKEFIFSEKGLESEIKGSIESLSKAIDSLSEKNDQKKSEFCVSLYLFRFKGLRQIMIVIRGLLSLIQTEEISEINTHLDPQFKKVFDLITQNIEHLGMYKSTLLEINIKLEETLLGCLDAIRNLNIPLFGENSQDNQLLDIISKSFGMSFGNDSYKRSASDFGSALDKLAENKMFYRINCELKVSKLKEFVKFQKIKVDNSFNISKRILQGLRNIPINFEIETLRHTIFKEYSNGNVQSDIFVKIANQINKEYLRRLIIFISEFQVQLQERCLSLMQILDFTELKGSFLWWSSYFDFAINKNISKEDKLSEISRILDTAISLFIKIDSFESKIVNLLSLDLFSKLIKDDKIDVKKFNELINKVQKHSKSIMLTNSYYSNYGTFMSNGYMGTENSKLLQDLFQDTNNRHQFEHACKALRDYSDQLFKNEQIRSALNSVDRTVYLGVQKYRRELEKFRVNMSSTNILFTMSIGYNDQYNLIFELIEKLLVGERNFEAYISNYLEMRNCIANLNYDYSQLTGITHVALREDSEKRIFFDPIRNRLLRFRDELMDKFNSLFDERTISSIESVFNTYLNAQIYLSGSLSQMIGSKENPEIPFNKYDFDLLYGSIVRAENLLFKSKGIKPSILPEDKLKERISFLHSIYRSYVQQISNLKDYLTEFNNNIFKESTLSQINPLKFMNLLNFSFDSIKKQLIQMFEHGSLNKNIEREVFEGIETLFLWIKSQEFEKVLDKLDIIYKSESLIELIMNGNSISLSQSFIDTVESMTALDSEPIEIKVEDKMAPWDSHTSASDYPASIPLKKENIKITHLGLDPGCTVAYLDRIENQNKPPESEENSNLHKLYNVVAIHCRISDVLGETISDFLKRRAQVKDSGSVTLPDFVVKQIDKEFYLNYLAVDFSLKYSLKTIRELESTIKQLFIMIPEFNIDYFLNLDKLVISGNTFIIDLNKEFIRTALTSLITYHSGMDFTSSFSFLYKSKVMVLGFPINKNGKLTKIRMVGKYSGFGGETPVSFAIVDDKQFQQDSSSLNKIQKGLFQSAISNYVSIYKNLAPLDSSHRQNREFVWIVNEKSHILYMLLLRSKIGKASLALKELGLIYPVADNAQNEFQISFANVFFNSISRRKSLNNLFYDVIKNKLIILNSSDNMRSYYDIGFSELESDTQLFSNISISQTSILDIPVYESDISQATESYLSDSLPLFCSSRRNYYDNSILLNINENFSYSELLSYRLLINVINPKILLKIRNLPSQYALRKIFNFGKELLLDFEKLRISYNLPIMNINDNIGISTIRENMKLFLKGMIQYTTYSQLERFSLHISPDLFRYKLTIPTTNNKSIVKTKDEVFQLNGITYFIVRYSEETIISGLSTLVEEVLNGRTNIVFLMQGLDLKLLRPGDLPSDSSPQIHLMKRVPIEFIPSERMVRIYASSYDTENLKLVYGIMSLYQGFDLSIVTDNEEYYYFNLLCWDSNNGTSKHCSYIQVFRYLKSNIFEKLKLYQNSLNNNISLSLIAEEGEILSLDFIGLSVISRFAGAVLFKADKYYELFYKSEQYWDLCSFVQEFYKFSTDLPIKAINYDPKIKDIIFKPDFSECPIPEIANLNIYANLPHFIKHNNNPQESGFVFTLYNSIRYQTLSILINYFLSGEKIFIKHEGIEDVSAPESILEILGYFDIRILKDSLISLFLNEISLKRTEVESAKIVSNQIRSIIPNSMVVGINIRNERIF
ncbi:Uncharacterized protein GY17_00002210 [Cryptosporidium hominis]|uniref:Uncharacterized protein n=2 Tax=Cryptosporidium hominis TaxID=237895 RepID=A0ABX5BEN3_CRYHO|nr:Uncharacterized protein GY17_00002210 [Cryptosporidium hominis]|eukprot:PPS95088.1 Uncharacterized protein GY17_00002210 [Cryptosporidium hominis]